MLGRPTFLLTGTDEHGQKIQAAAAAAGTSPMQFCDEISALYRQLFDASGISYDDFIRTTEPRHKTAVQHLWNVLESKGHLYPARHEGWYCVADESFLTPNQVTEAPDASGGMQKVSLESGRPVEWIQEDTTKFRLSAFQERVKHWLKQSRAVQPDGPLGEALSFVSGASIPDLSVSRPRARVSWGIGVPGRESQETIYVWIDALANYISAAGYPDQWQSRGLWPASYQIIGKDITKFHAVYWPALLMAAELPLPKRIIAHAHWTVGRAKMSKSAGNVIDPAEEMATYGVDAVRFFLLKEGGLEQDADYSRLNLEASLNGFLADQLGNLLLRVLSRTINSAQRVPLKGPYQDADMEIIAVLRNTRAAVHTHYADVDFRRAIAQISAATAAVNKYFTDSEPWVLKKTRQVERMNTIVYVTAEAVRMLCLMLLPIMPQAMTAALDRLGIAPDRRTADALVFGELRPGDALAQPEQNPPLFVKRQLVSQQPTTEGGTRLQAPAKGGKLQQQLPRPGASPKLP
jgi:methionyl-tRNA synthetase